MVSCMESVKDNAKIIGEFSSIHSDIATVRGRKLSRITFIDVASSLQNIRGITNSSMGVSPNN